MVKIWKKAVLFYVGGMLYTCLELLWRGRSHGSMFVLGGCCFVCLGALHRLPLPMPLQIAAGGLLITVGELLTGLLVNRSYTVWDYREMPMNFAGQICLPFSLLWLPVSYMAMVIYGWLENQIPCK